MQLKVGPMAEHFRVSAAALRRRHQAGGPILAQHAAPLAVLLGASLAAQLWDQHCDRVLAAVRSNSTILGEHPIVEGTARQCGLVGEDCLDMVASPDVRRNRQRFQ